MWNLHEKKAIVTGGTKGIGRATVKEFLQLGAHVIFTARNNDDVSSLELELQAEYGDKVFGFASDVSSTSDLDALYEFVNSKFEALDILVNNAGINIRKSAQEYTKEEYQKVININLLAPFELSRRVFPLLKHAKNATIINVSSVASNQDVKSGAPYGMAKSGLNQMTRSLAAEWAQYNIRVNAVSPWYTQTPLTEAVFEDQKRLNQITKRTPLERVAQPHEMANVITFLAMDKASYITGQNIIADGGMSIKAL